MPKYLISVGFDVPGDVVESVGYDSNSSLLDGDVIIFSPDLRGYSSSENHNGKRCLDEDDSGRVRSDTAHWQRELNIALGAGKTVFVMMTGSGDVYAHTGETRYSGNGRNARGTRIVGSFDSYSSIPLPGLAEAIRRRTGERIKSTKNLGPLAAYWLEFSAATYYQAYLESNIGTPTLVTQTGDKMVGGIVRFKQTKGTLVLLPMPNFAYMVDERLEQLGNKAGAAAKGGAEGSQQKDARQAAEVEAEKKAEESVGNQFVSALIEIDDILRVKANKTPAPTWANAEEYALGEEVGFRIRMGEIEARITDLQKQKVEADRKLDSAGNLRGLMFETGKPLESAILEALRTIGFGAEGFADEESEFDAVFTDPSGNRLLGEAEGKNDKAINIDKLDQLERNVQEDFGKRGDSTDYAKGVLFGNAFRLSPPADRGDYFTPKCLAGAKRLGFALVRTPDLFTAAKFLKENSDPDFAASCRKAILDTSGGIVVFPTLPTSATTGRLSQP